MAQRQARVPAPKRALLCPARCNSAKERRAFVVEDVLFCGAAALYALLLLIAVMDASAIDCRPIRRCLPAL